MQRLPTQMQGVLRWAVNVTAWQPTAEQWSVVLSCLPPDEQARCLRYRQEADQKRAVVSQLLQRACIAQVLGVPWEQIQLQRTKGNKPFYAGPANRQHMPNFNYNVSHEGDYVVLASEGWCVCGVDVTAPLQLRSPGSKRSLSDTLKLLRNQLSDSEWSLIESLSGDESAMEAAFQSMWTCKEAFIKARGDGIAFEPLSRIQAQLPHPTAAAAAAANTAQPRPAVQAIQLVVDGKEQPNVKAYLQQLPNNHWVAVVRASPDCIVDAAGAFKASLSTLSLPEQQLQACLDACSPPFDMLIVEDLLPAAASDQYVDCSITRRCELFT